jgi:arsenical pump membrane protein
MAGRVVSPADLASGLEVLWRPFLTIISIMFSTASAQRLGILNFFARLFEPHSDQSTAFVFRSVFIFSAITSAVLNNDAAVLLLTPLIVGLIRRCYPDRQELILPFAFAVFSAAGVAPLVISNPMNLIVAEYAGIGFNEYAARMIPIAVVGWLTTYAVLRLIFRSELHTASGKSDLGIPPPILSRPAKQFLGVMIVALGCFPALSYAGGPVWVIAAVAATLGAWLCSRNGIISPMQLAAAVSWEILIFLFCIFVIVLGLRNVGFVDQITELYSSASTFAAKIALIGISSAIGSAILNNHPMAILNALAIHNLPQSTKELMLAALVGGDLGPRLLPMGSLAGLIWLDLLRRQGIHISVSQFILVGLPVTIPTLGLSLMILLVI